MSLGASLLLYLLMGSGVAVAVGVAGGEQRLFRIVCALFFWPLFVPMLLAGPRTTTDLPTPRLDRSNDELTQAITQADADLHLALDSLPAYLPHLKAGRVRALAVASRERSRVMPELPTMAQAGVPGVISATDYAVYAPAGTPREIIALLNREVNAVLEMPDLRDKLTAQGIEIVPGTPEAVHAELLEEIAKWGRVIAAAKLKPE